MLAVDIERSSGRGNVALVKIRDALFAALREAFQQSGIDWDACLRHDTGDGARVILPAGVEKSLLIHPLLHELTIRLRAHNRTAGSSTQIRVRIAVHAGDVILGRDDEVTGQPLEVLARMLDAPPARDALAEAPESASAVAIISQHFYDEVVQHGYPGIDPEAFRKVRLTVKEYVADAWLHVPLCAALPRPPERDASEDRTPHSFTMISRASERGVVYATQNGSQHIHVNEKP
jgi:hypothetical protein